MTSLETTSESVGKDQVKLRVEVPEDALAPALKQVYNRFARDIKVPGFRKGKVPRQLIDARVGPEVIREEALRAALPDFYREALKAEELEAIAPPDIEVVEFEAGAPLVFEATVDVRPEITLPDLPKINIDSPPSEVTDADIDEQLERLRDRFAELESASRDARRGDFVLIDLNGSRNDQPVPGASAPDYLYEVGSRSGPPKLDDELEGARAGAILKFTDTVPGEALGEPGQEKVDVSFTVLVKEVKVKKLPPLDDDFAKTVGEFDTLDELKEDLRGRLQEVKINTVEEELRGLVLRAIVDASDLEAPEKLVEGEFNHRMEHIEEDLKQAGLTLDQYGQTIDSTELEIRRDVREEAARSVKAELLLEEVARTREIEVTQEDLGLQIAYMAARSGVEPKELAEQLVSQGRLAPVAADVMRRKALDIVVEEVNVVGRPIRPEVPPLEAREEEPLQEEDADQSSV
jgi:trigger factor